MPGEKRKLIDEEDGRRRECCVDGFYDNWIRPLIAEFVGVLIFVLAASLSVATNDIFTIGVVNGLTILFLAVAFAPISGAHLNPAVTFGVLISGFITPTKALLYVFFQLAGAIAGAAIFRGILDQISYLIIAGGTPIVAGTTSIPQAVGIELLLIFLLVVVFLVAQVDHESPLGPVAHGLVYLVGVTIAFNISGGVINITRSFGTSVIYSIETLDHWLEQWIYYVAGAAGAALAAVTYKLTLASDARRWKCMEPKKME